MTLHHIHRLLVSLLLLCSLGASAKDFVIILDPGHGGKDPGCIGQGGTKEKNVNLAIALKLGSLLDNLDGVRVVYTRKTDVFVTLNGRTDIANNRKADLFVSIHADAVKGSDAYGTGSFTLGTAKTQENLEVAKRENSVILLEDDYKTRYQGFDPNSAESYIMFETLQGTHQKQSIELATLFQKQFKNRAGRRDRQVRQAPYLVLKTASMPAVLVETGFLSNRNEEKFLASSDGQNKIANAMFYAIKEYKESFDRHNNPSSSSAPTASASPAPGRIERDEPARPDGDPEPQAPTASPSRKPSGGNASTASSASPGKKPAASNGKKTLTYKVQFLSYHKKLNKGASQLKGLWPVEYEIDSKGTYRYTYGSTTSFNEAVKTQKKVREKFKDAFVVRYENGERASK